MSVVLETSSPQLAFKTHLSELRKFKKLQAFEHIREEGTITNEARFVSYHDRFGAV
jgi:hypothetical protein